ncbi:hypothetical protein COOONC_01174 [Cooperia oncophora]
MRYMAMRMEVEAKIRASSSPITECDLSRALAHSRLAVQFATKGKQTELSLSDVGGMELEKRTLIEVLMWPMKTQEVTQRKRYKPEKRSISSKRQLETVARCVKHTKVFDAYGIHLGNAVLLHGPSGCGKTHLAKAIVTHFGLKSIFIKLLNKVANDGKTFDST